MARSVITGLIIALLILGAFMLGRNRAVVPSVEANAALAEWLNTSCSVGEGTQAEDALRKFGSQLERPLINLFEQGPAPSEIARIEALARREFNRLQALVDSGNAAGLTDNDVQALRDSPADKFVARARDEYVGSRRAAALAGLGVTGGRQGRRLLEQLAADQNSPYQEVARLARYSDTPPGQK